VGVMARFKLLVEYAGTRYSGWQIQKNARTIQGEIDRAIRLVVPRTAFELYGAGRTDAGVHALGQVAHLDLHTSLPPAALVDRINDGLPADINILSAVIVPHRFHARHDALARSYLYQIALRRTAFGKPYVWWIRDRLDVAAMREATRPLVGLRDFRSFTDDDPDEKSTLVELAGLDIGESGDLILVRIVGSHFLWKMVRRIVGVLVEVGRGRLRAADAGDLLVEHSGMPARLTAPASGLFLERVLYDGDARDWPLQQATGFTSFHAEGADRPIRRVERPRG
jgi:tRNA pseudouridine38-40 synthase